VALASRSDVAIVFAGLTDDWESEGFDRPDMELPGRQAELIERWPPPIRTRSWS